MISPMIDEHDFTSIENAKHSETLENFKLWKKLSSPYDYDVKYVNFETFLNPIMKENPPQQSEKNTLYPVQTESHPRHLNLS